MSKVFLIIGATGLIGNAVAQELGDKHKWFGTSYSKVNSDILHLDITDQDNISKLFEEIRPGYVINCVNLKGGVDFCGKNPQIARKIHYEGTINIAKECLKYDAKLSFISSECVFDGKKENYSEEDSVNPLNIYGKYKAESEEWIRKNLQKYSIARTMSVYGWDPQTESPNPVMSVYFSIQKRNKIFIPAFRYGNPTYVRDLAKAIIELSLSQENGLFHIAGNSYINRYEWLKKTCEALGWDASYLVPLEKAPRDMVFRPYKINLDTTKFRKIFKTRLNNLEEGLNLLKNDIISVFKPN